MPLVIEPDLHHSIMKSSRSTERVLDFSMSVDGRVISDTEFYPAIEYENAREVFVRIHPVIQGASEVMGGRASLQGFLSEDQRFVLKSMKVEGSGAVRLHYIRSRKKRGQRS